MQAVIITAYQNMKQLYELAELLNKKFEVYIHIDKRISEDEIKKSGLYKMQHVKVYSLFHINWGGQIIFGQSCI